MDSTAQSAHDPPDAVPAVGTVLAGKYRIEEIVGTGGMGVVLGARHVQLGQQVAIKVLRPSDGDRDEAKTRFLREGKAAAGLTSDHVVRIHDVGELPNGTLYMVMELLRGRDLAEHIATASPIPIAEAVDFVMQACDSIAEAHAAGIVHRDLKPANLFLTQRSNGSPLVKVLDFGISKARAVRDGADIPATLTSTRTVIGSPAYMAPEQIRDAKHVDHRADIWSLGLILYELLTGNQAFAADTLPAVCAAIAADDPIPVGRVRPEVPELLADVVERCLQKNPDQRFQSIQELTDALAMFAFRTAATARSSQLASGSRSKPPSQSRTMPSVPTDPEADTVLSGERVRIVTGPESEAEVSSTLKSLGPPPQPAEPARTRLVGPFGAVLAFVLLALLAWLFLRPDGPPAARTRPGSAAAPSAAEPAPPLGGDDHTPTAATAAAVEPPEIAPAPDLRLEVSSSVRPEPSAPPPRSRPVTVPTPTPATQTPTADAPSTANAPGIRLER